jgi:predicted LPLAT superfamily acyltransferase
LPHSVAVVADPAWTGRSHGGRWGTAAAWWLIRLGGRDLCYVLVTVPALWFWLFNCRARRALVAYWQRQRPGLSGFSARLYALRHLWEFARTLADRVLITRSPRALTFTTAGLEHLVSGMSRGKGCILLSAHVGSFELAARLLIRERAAMLNLVMLDGEDPRVQAQLRHAMGERPYRVIDLRDPGTAALEIAAALGRDETCCMLGDRVLPGSQAALTAPFLGAGMRFPTGPFLAAAATGATIIPTFCVRRSWATWHCVALAPFTVDLGRRGERQERLSQVITDWAELLEREVRASPWAWNNYFDVWADALTPPAPA